MPRIRAIDLRERGAPSGALPFDTDAYLSGKVRSFSYWREDDDDLIVRLLDSCHNVKRLDIGKIGMQAASKIAQSRVSELFAKFDDNVLNFTVVNCVNVKNLEVLLVKDSPLNCLQLASNVRTLSLWSYHDDDGVPIRMHLPMTSCP